MFLTNRQTGQNTSEDLRVKDYRRELHTKERIAFKEKEAKRHKSSYASSTTLSTPLALPSSSSSSAALGSTKKIKSEGHLPLNIDADDPIVLFNRQDADDDENDDEVDKDLDNENQTNSEADSDDESDEDDTAELLAELNRIKKERAMEEAKKEAEQKAREEQIRMENILRGNPLTAGKGEFKVKRRWDDDVVFKNCSREDVDDKVKPFINDTIRSEFHKKFMEKYIQ